MRNRLTKILLSGGAAALAVSLTATTAGATTATTWSVSPGGAISISGSAQVKDESTGTIAKCTSIKLTGTLKSGTGLSGTNLGSVTAGTFTGCTIATIAITVATSDLPWHVDALSYNATTKVATGKLVGVELLATATGCSATLAGTTASNGYTKFTYNNTTGKLALVGAGGTLENLAVTGCFGLENKGDKQEASGTTTLTPKQSIVGS